VSVWHGLLCALIAERESGGKRGRLLLDSRVVDVLRLSNLILVTLSSLKLSFLNSLKKGIAFL